MGKIEELIKQLCPDGVKFVKLGDFFDMFKGMSKVSKKWADTGNCRFIDYLNIYNNMTVDVTKLQNATVATFKQNKLKEGDILFTCASETPYECAISAVIREPIAENTFLDDHLNGIRVKREFEEIVLPAFINYYFYSVAFRKSICKIVRGVTRFYIVNKSFLNIMIPLPPLAVQKEIVEILDTFTGMIDNLQKELDHRQKQFEYYRNVLLCFENGEAEVNELNKIAEYSKSRIEASDLNKANYVSVENLLQNKEGKVDSACCPTEGRWTKFMPGDILVGNIRPYLKKIWYADCEGGTNGDVLDIRVTSDKVSSKYLFKVLSSDNFFEYDTQSSAGAKMPRGKKDIIMKYHIPVPSLETQQEIVDKLDTFEALISNIKQEIELRQKQYEYYREKLLSFE